MACCFDVSLIERDQDGDLTDESREALEQDIKERIWREGECLAEDYEESLDSIVSSARNYIADLRSELKEHKIDPSELYLSLNRERDNLISYLETERDCSWGGDAYGMSEAEWEDNM